MKNYFKLITLISLTSLIIYSCNRYYIKQDFRQNYIGINDTIHNDLYNNPFFKVHLKNGDVSVLKDWHLNPSRDSVFGYGKLFDFNRTEIRSGSISHNIDEIAIIETNQLDAIKAKDKEKISALSIITGANLVLDVVCITNPKACFGSCPTFYTGEVNSVHDAIAEGFSSSISPALEKLDMDALNTRTSSTEFSLIMKNEAFETHMINELFLDIIPKKKSELVFQDKENNFYKVNDLIKPIRATLNNANILNKISEIDEKEFFSQTNELDLTKQDEIILEFNSNKNEDKGLVINFRQTLLTTFLMYSGLSYMGNEVGDYFTKIETSESIKKRLSNPFKLLGKIKLFVWNDQSNKWILFDELYETGPIAKNLMLAKIDNKNTRVNDNVKIKIELTKGLWRLDYLGLAHIKESTQSSKVYPSKLEVINGNSYNVNRVQLDDDDYLISFPGDAYEFQFHFPELQDHDEYEIFLSSKGYYLEWMRKSWLQNKNVDMLEKMLSNNKEVWVNLAIEYKGLEPVMDEVFWNSKYINEK